MVKVIDGESRFGAEDKVLTALDRLAGDLSSTLIHLDPSHVTGAIDDVLRRIVEALEVDRSSLVVYSEDGASIDQTHAWARPGIALTSADHRQFVPWYVTRLLRGDTVVLNRLPDDLPPEARSDREFLTQSGVKSQLVVPVAVGGQNVCALGVSSFQTQRTWTPAVVERLRLLAEIVAGAMYRGQQDRSLRDVRAEVARLKGRLGSENEYLREEIEHLHGFDEIVGESAALRVSLARVSEVASTDATVLLLGDTGTGKELFARAIHQRSPRRPRALVRVNCAALPATLIESELFGHERGAFTGAVTARQGRFELADRGTLFLDEIGDLPLDVQAKLLRVLQEGEFERLGSSHTRKVDVRLIAATHRDLEAGVAEERFRSDLFYRLNVFPIRIPTLRERREDIPRLVWFLIHRRQRALRRHITVVPAPVMDMLQQYEWPGNVRELENVVERAMIRSPGDTLVLHEGLGGRSRPITSGSSVGTGSAGDATLDHVERRHIEDVLQRCDWRINGKGNAAEQLGLHPNTLRFRMQKLGIRRPVKGSPSE